MFTVYVSAIRAGSAEGINGPLRYIWFPKLEDSCRILEHKKAQAQACICDTSSARIIKSGREYDGYILEQGLGYTRSLMSWKRSKKYMVVYLYKNLLLPNIASAGRLDSTQFLYTLAVMLNFVQDMSTATITNMKVSASFRNFKLMMGPDLSANI